MNEFSLDKSALRYATGCGTLIEAADMIDGILIDPVSAPDAHTSNDVRPIEEIMNWWRLPYVVTNGGHIAVYCLDGGAHDRPTLIGQGATIAEGVELAKAYRPKIASVYYAG